MNRGTVITGCDGLCPCPDAFAMGLLNRCRGFRSSNSVVVRLRRWRTVGASRIAVKQNSLSPAAKNELLNHADRGGEGVFRPSPVSSSGRSPTQRHTMLRGFFVFSVLALAVSSALAHDTWVQTNTNIIRVGD